MNEYWGQLPSIVETDSGIIAVERAEITTMKQLKVQNIQMDFNYNSNHNDEDDDYANSCVSHVPIGNPILLHSIKLLKFIRQFDSNTNNESITRDSLPQLVESDDKLFNKYSVQKISGRNINQMAVKQLMRRALVLITVFYGYENTTESILDLLVDITCQYLLRMCQTIRSATDSVELRSSNDFVDVIDRVFHDMNVPDFESLRQYDLDMRLYNQNLMKDALRKIGTTESIASATKANPSEFSLNSQNFSIIANSDKSPHLSANIPSDAKDIEPTLSLRSLLNSNKVRYY